MFMFISLLLAHSVLYMCHVLAIIVAERTRKQVCASPLPSSPRPRRLLLIMPCSATSFWGRPSAPGMKTPQRIARLRRPDSARPCGTGCRRSTDSCTCASGAGTHPRRLRRNRCHLTRAGTAPRHHSCMLRGQLQARPSPPATFRKMTDTLSIRAIASTWTPSLNPRP